MNTRLLGAAVLVALAILFVPMFFSSHPPATTGDQSVSLAIPPAPDRDLQTKTMSLNPQAGTAPAAAGSTQAAATVTPAASGGLATVNINDSRPQNAQPPAVATAPAQQPVIPATPTPVIASQQPTTTPAIKQRPAIVAQPEVVQPEPALPPATAARGIYSINLSAYAPTGAAGLIQRVRGLGYPASGRPIQRAGKTLTLVSAGPFETRAAAEAARLKISQSIPSVPARLESGATTPQGDVAAPAVSSKAGGWAVQVAAMGSQADANALRDKLRANGFDGFVDTVNANGKQLWRVRAGPQTQRSDALSLRDQIRSKLGISGNVVSVP